MSGDIKFNVDFEPLLRYGLDRVLALFGRDSLTTEDRERLDKLTRLATERATTVMVVGMNRPLPIKEIYQPTKLKSSSGKNISVESFLKEPTDSIILGGPGRGKTTFIHWMFVSLLERPDWVPILITLRRTTSLEDLRQVVAGLSSRKSKITKSHRVALLVDGYDEIPLKERKLASELVEEFRSLQIGAYYLTSRLYYDIIDIRAPHYHISPFDPQDALRYLAAFGKAYGGNFDARELLEEMQEHGFADFAESPLLLALVCILKSGPMTGLPRNTVGLIRRAVDTLTFRWDESKGIYRETTLPLDGEDRVRCLMRLAYGLAVVDAPEEKVRRVVAQQLELLQAKSVDVSKLLQEIAQWYGLFVPISESRWGFVHRTIQDFLAARYWVESGKFSPSRVTEWNARAAYAACLVPDATTSLVEALNKDPGILAVVECLYNNAAFDPGIVAVAVEDHFKKFGGYSLKSETNMLVAETSQDFFAFAKDELINAILLRALDPAGHRHRSLLLAYTLAEVVARETSLTAGAYNRLRRIYERPNFRIRVKRKAKWQDFRIDNVKPPKEQE
jgi:hypothetical protein